MGKLVSAGITPHGSSIIAEIAGSELELFKPTRDAMQELGKRVMSTKPDTIVILTPHGMRLKDYNAVYTTAYCRGSLSANNNTVSLAYKCDKQLSYGILEQAENESIPVVGCNYGALSGKGSNIVMDWGTFIPLWFCQDEAYQPEIVVIGPTREIPLNKLVRLGEIIAEQILNSDKNVALIASADQAHCHDKNHPSFGYHEAAKQYDDRVTELIKQNNLAELVSFDLNWVANAKPDSLWQMIMLYGATKVVPMKGEFLSYQVPTYFGMTVASYKPI